MNDKKVLNDGDVLGSGEIWGGKVISRGGDVLSGGDPIKNRHVIYHVNFYVIRLVIFHVICHQRSQKQLLRQSEV